MRARAVSGVRARAVSGVRARAVSSVRGRAVSLCASLALVGLAGCAAKTNTAIVVRGTTLTVYASRPPAGTGGQAAGDVLDAEQLALQQAGGKAGKYQVKIVRLDGTKLSDNARAAVQDPTAIAYLGELVPGTSQTSVEITNELGLLEVSPVDTADYLTQATPAVSGAPGKYYPLSTSYHQTFARVVPTTVQEAAAQVAEMSALHLSKLYVSSDGKPYGASIALEVRQDARSRGLTVTQGHAGASPPAGLRRGYAEFYGAGAGPAATRWLDQAAVASPSAKLFGPSGLYDDSFAAGLSATAQKNLYVSSPGFAFKSQTPAQRQFASSFAAAYGHQPAPQAIYGYEAMSALLAVLTNAGVNASNRAVVVSEFRTLKDRQSPVLGTYSIVGGDSNVSSFVFAQPKSGKLVPLT